MTDRYNALTVVLDRDIRDDDAEAILTAIRMVRGVMSVDPIVSDPSSWVAEMRIRSAFRKALFAALDNPDLKD